MRPIESLPDYIVAGAATGFVTDDWDIARARKAKAMITARQRMVPGSFICLIQRSKWPRHASHAAVTARKG